eukprot:TRINITY_DN7589_c0_g1_i1.p2 TRINITY_DN7589_c0_g1~~TRINITY_DN7589_c0_g1_i1.p2  ORF type:complete len:153 (+),score=40.57 TRINITY_DN7589_c0_g1_i1:54-512(+)
MSGFAVVLPKEYGWVVLAGGFSIMVAQYLGGRVGGARKKYGVKLPIMYDNQNPLNPFNGYQRGHQNMLESHYQVMALLFLGGLRYPLISAVAGAAWAVGRIFYAHGYSQEENGKLNPEFRYRSILTPILMYPSLLALLGSTFAFGAQLLGWI